MVCRLETRGRGKGGPGRGGGPLDEGRGAGTPAGMGGGQESSPPDEYVTQSLVILVSVRNEDGKRERALSVTGHV